MRVFAASILIAGASFVATPCNSEALDGPRFKDQASRERDVADREARSRDEKVRAEKQQEIYRKRDEDYYMNVHPNQPRVGDNPGLPYTPSGSAEQRWEKNQERDKRARREEERSRCNYRC